MADDDQKNFSSIDRDQTSKVTIEALTKAGSCYLPIDVNADCSSIIIRLLGNAS